jgi:MHS family proline/betaine transporter-like MFS transporter
MSKKVGRVVASAMAGNALEMYDFALYGIFAKIISTEFFPQAHPSAALLATLAIYASGFFMRPFGGIVFGYMGDKLGRKIVLSMTILLMAVPTFIIGIMPSYESIGILAPIMILICRLLQGLCAGAEYNSASIFLIEHLSSKKLPAFAGSLVSASGAIGSILGLLAYLGVAQGYYHWRMAFIFGSILMLVAIYIRGFAPESPEFKKNAMRKTTAELLSEIFSKYKNAFFITMTIGAFQGTLAYLLFVYMKIYMSTQTSLSMGDISLFNFVSLLAFLFCTPLFGYYSDKIGHVNMMRIGLVGLLLSIYLQFSVVLKEEFWPIIVNQWFLGMFIGLSVCAASALMNRLFPAKLRCTGISFGYNLGVAIFGGTLPLFSEWYIATYSNQHAPALFIIGVILLGLLGIHFALPVKMREDNLVLFKA